LLTLQRYQEKQAKGEPFDPTTFTQTISTRGASTSRRSEKKHYDSDFESSEFDDEVSNDSFKATKKRGGLNDDDDDWVLDQPRKYIKKADREKTENKKQILYVSDVQNKSQNIIETPKTSQIVVRTTSGDVGAIKKNIIYCNRPSEVTPKIVMTPGDVEKSPEKSLLASKLKMKVAQKVVSGIPDEQAKTQKLQVKIQHFHYCFYVIF
jgi:hypothetical protein